jgi:hypothetical protein
MTPKQVAQEHAAQEQWGHLLLTIMNGAAPSFEFRNRKMLTWSVI